MQFIFPTLMTHAGINVSHLPHPTTHPPTHTHTHKRQARRTTAKFSEEEWGETEKSRKRERRKEETPSQQRVGENKRVARGLEMP